MAPSRRREILRLAGGGLTAGIAGCVRLTFTDDSPDAPAGDCEVDAPTAQGVHDVGDGGWPMPGYDPANTSYAPDETAPDLDNLEVAWTHQASDAEVLVSGETVLASTEETFTAFDADTGEKRWTYEGDEERTNSKFTIRDDTAYCCRFGGSSSETVVIAFDHESGEKQWEREITGRPVEHLTITDRELVFGTFAGNPGNWEGRIYSLDPRDGSPHWVNDSIRRYPSSAPAIAENLIYIGLQNSNLRALDRETGGRCSIIDSRDVRDVSVSGGNVYVTRRSTGDGPTWWIFQTYDGKENEKQWGTNPLSGLTDIVSGQIITEEYVLLTSHDGIFALTHDGSLVWEREEVEDEPVPMMSPCIVKKTLFTGGSSGIYAFDVETGELQESVAIEAEDFSGFRVANGTLYLTDSGGGLSVGDAAPGAIVALR